MANGTPGNLAIGPGLLYAAPIGTTEPTTATAALPSAWRQIGYTEDGTEVDFTVKSEPIYVAEELEPVLYIDTMQDTVVSFQMAEATRQNLALALNQGASGATSGSIEPSVYSSKVRVMLILQADNGSRWLFRQAFQNSDVKIMRKKAPQKTLLPVTFNLEKPATAQSWIAFPNSSGLI